MRSPPFHFALLLLFLGSVFPRRAAAQILRADWVDQTQKSIADCRMCDARVLVLDRQGKPAPGVQVHLVLQQHAFPLGVPAEALALEARQPDATSAPLWRCFNAVALDQLTDWARLQPTAITNVDWQPVEAIVAKAAAAGMFLRWGPVVQADPGRLPDWLAELHGQALSNAINHHVDQVFQTFGRRVTQFDIYAGALSHAFVEDRLGVQGLRTMVERARVAAPGTGAILCLRFSDALDGQRLQQMIRHIAGLRESFINIDMIALEGRFSGNVVQTQLARSLQWLRALDVPVVMVGLETGGPSPAAAAINEEIVLRTLFAEPCVKGIWFRGLRGDDLTDPNGALVDQDGKPTPVGMLVDGLFHGLWGFDATQATDSLGEWRCRVPPGVYQITAGKFGDFSTTGNYLVSGGDTERLIVLQAAREK